MNEVILMGRLAADPELRETPDGVKVLSFRVAVHRKHEKNGTDTDFVECVAWRKLAEHINSYWRKGEMIAITGHLESQKWEDRNGTKRTSWEVIVDEAHFCGGGKRQDV